MKLIVSSYSFSQYMRKGELDWISVLDKAKELGFEGIEYSSDRKTMEPLVERIRKHSEEIGLPVVAYLTSANFVSNEVDAEVERLKGEVEIAVALGAKLMRHDTTFALPAGKTFEEVLPRLAEGCRRVTEYAQTRGVRTMVENHGQHVQQPDRMLALYRAVGHENFSLLCDIGNFMCADEEPAHAVSLVAPFAAHVHAKDFLFKSGDSGDPGKGWFGTRAANYLRGTIIGHGVVPVRQCLRILKNAGYDGYLSVEFEGLEDCVMGCELGKEFLAKTLAELR